MLRKEWGNLVKNTKTIRVDPEYWEKIRQSLPRMSDAQRSKALACPEEFEHISKKAQTFRKFIRNDRGSAEDLAFMFIVLTVFAVFILLFFTIGSAINDKIQESTQFDANSKSLIDRTNDSFTTSFDNSFLLLTIFLSIAALVLAALVRISPIFIPFFILLLIIIIILSAISSNVYTAMEENSNLAVYAAQLHYTHAIMTYLPIIVGAIGILLMTVSYKAWSGLQQ